MLQLTTGSPAPDLDEALGIAVVLGEDALLVKARARAALVHGVAEEPRRAAQLVERGQRSEPLQEQEDGEDRLREVVALRCAAGNVDDRQAEGAPVVLAEEVHDAHRAGRIAFGRRERRPTWRRCRWRSWRRRRAPGVSATWRWAPGASLPRRRLPRRPSPRSSRRCGGRYARRRPSPRRRRRRGRRACRPRASRKGFTNSAPASTDSTG